MKKKNQNIELIKDDEILREEGMADGPLKVGKLELRPITALTVSWMQRNQIFSDSKDAIWKAAAFAFLHSVDHSIIRQVVNDYDSFLDAVDVWIEHNMVHHNEATAITQAMNDAFQRYMASVSEFSGGGSGGRSGSGSGN